MLYHFPFDMRTLKSYISIFFPPPSFVLFVSYIFPTFIVMSVLHNYYFCFNYILKWLKQIENSCNLPRELLFPVLSIPICRSMFPSGIMCNFLLQGFPLKFRCGGYTCNKVFWLLFFMFLIWFLQDIFVGYRIQGCQLFSFLFYLSWCFSSALKFFCHYVSYTVDSSSASVIPSAHMSQFRVYSSLSCPMTHWLFFFCVFFFSF